MFPDYSADTETKCIRKRQQTYCKRMYNIAFTKGAIPFALFFAYHVKTAGYQYHYPRHTGRMNEIGLIPLTSRGFDKESAQDE